MTTKFSSRHADKNYTCPICLGIQGIENPQTLLKQTDRIHQDELVSAFINSFWVEHSEGHVIVVPNAHHENIYELPAKTGARIFILSQYIAIAMKKAYDCDGITIRQNNEPAGDQHALHYHLHIFPRYHGDNFNQNAAHPSRLSHPDERQLYARKLLSQLVKDIQTDTK